MINESSPIIKNINQNESEKSEDININKSEKIYLKNKNISLLKEEENKSIQVINPFDSIASKKINLKSFSKNINNRYSKNNSINNSIYNSNTYKQYNNFSYSLSTNKDKNKQINDSNDINFETINNDSAINLKYSNNNYKSSIYSSSNISYNNFNNGNKKEEFKIIKESDEDEINEENVNNYLGEIHLEDLELYVDKYYNNINDRKHNNKYEINKRISDIINNSPFENLNIILKNNTNDVDLEKLLTFNNIVYIKNLDNEQISKKFDEDFYSQILSAKKFSELNKDLHYSEQFNSNFNISVTQLYTYNGTNINLIGKKTRDITTNDGNSFIKAFIFNYMENIITNLYINKLTFIIYIISTKLTLIVKKDIKLNVTEVLTILKIIYTHMKQNSTKEAYIVLINAFKENSEFEKGLIYFIKYCVQQFIIDNHIFFNLEYLNYLIVDRYVNILNNQFDYKLYLEEKIIPEKTELQYQILIYYILPLIFDINLIIHTNNNINSNKIYFKSNSNNKEEKINIELNIKFGNTSIIYDEAFYNKNKDIIPYVNDYEYPCDQIEKTDEEIFCKKCNIKSIFIKLRKQIKPLCEKCLINILKKVINKRYIFLKQDLFLHEEYYCSKIRLTDALENNLFLSLNDIKIIMPEHKDISEEIYKLIITREKCHKCNQIFKLKKYSICLSDCGHIICNECFFKYIDDITHKRIILNKFELITEGLQYTCPCISCENIINKKFEFLIYKYIDNIELYKKQAEERLLIQYKRFCCICKKVCNEYFFNFNEIKHVLCNDCKNFLENQKKLNDKRSAQTKFMCIFCEENHNFNLINFLKNNKERNESCCAIF